MSAALAFVHNTRNTIYVSSVTAWELAIKNRLGKPLEAAPLLEHYHRTLAAYGFTELSFTSTHALLAGRLDHPHKDPFDRALVAQAISQQVQLVSADPALRGFPGVTVLW